VISRGLRFVGKGILWLILPLIVAFAIFAAFNWTLTKNMAAAAGKPYAEIAHLTPQQDVKGCGERAIIIAEEQPMSQDSLQKMQDFSDKHRGLGLLVMVDGKRVYERYAPGISAATKTQTLSMNKSVTGLMIGVAQMDGTITSIDDPLGGVITEWAGDSRKNITLRALITMSSGLHNYSMTKGDWPAMKQLMSDEIESTAIATDAVKPPLADFRYKNADAQVAGAVLRRSIAKANKGESYASYLSRTLWCDVGNAPATLWAESETGAPRFYAGLQATLPDWARLGQLILDGGKVGAKQVVPSGWIAQMTAPSPTNPNYGFLIWRGSPWKKLRTYSPEAGIGVTHSAPYAADDVIFMDGYGGQRVYIVPSAKLVIARTSEADRTFDDAPLVNLALAGLKAPPK
jgi:CubicO group peptidase (beta-lactamase class C family)